MLPLESGFYLFLTRKWVLGALKINNPVDLSGRIRTVEFQETAEAITKKVQFSRKQLDALLEYRITGISSLISQVAGQRVQDWATKAVEANKRFAERMRTGTVTQEEWRESLR